MILRNFFIIYFLNFRLKWSDILAFSTILYPYLCKRLIYLIHYCENLTSEALNIWKETYLSKPNILQLQNVFLEVANVRIAVGEAFGLYAQTQREQKESGRTGGEDTDALNTVQEQLTTLTRDADMDVSRKAREALGWTTKEKEVISFVWFMEYSTL